SRRRVDRRAVQHLCRSGSSRPSHRRPARADGDPRPAGCRRQRDRGGCARSECRGVQVLGGAGIPGRLPHLSVATTAAMSAFEVLSVECPRFERVPKASVATVGAVAVVSAKAGLIALLDSPVAGGQHLLGSGYQAPLTVPFGIAVSAAIGAL